MTDIAYIEQCPTTMEAIVPYIKLNPSSKFCLYTFNQTEGRGQYGNRWDSAKHLNLALSFAVPLELVVTSHTFFNFYTALLIRDYLSDITAKPTKIKWPNDTIISGKKVSGFIIEKQKIDSVEYFIIGIGINVLQQNFDTLPKAGSLANVSDKNYDLHEIAKTLFEILNKGFTYPLNDGDILTNYNHHLFKKNEIAVYVKNNIRQNGIIRHVDADGYIWIELECDGLQKFYHKEIEMLY